METIGGLWVISAPSGTGKSTLCELLRESEKNVSVSISFTTRRPRPGERDGLEYHFVSRAEFEKMIHNGEFLEWAEVHHQFYGTAKKQVLALVNQGKQVLFDIDVQGGLQIKKACPQAGLVFILPPSMQELRRRLTQRGTEDASQLQVRLANAQRELEQGLAYDFHIVNSDLEDALAQLRVLVVEKKDAQTPKADHLIFDLLAQCTSG